MDPVLLTPEHANRSTLLSDLDNSSSVAPTSTTYTIHAQHPTYHPPPVIRDDGAGEYIAGILPSEKFLPPGFVPLSPIPILSNLTSIPESCSRSDTNDNPPSPKHNDTASPTMTGKPSSPGLIYSSVPVPGPLSGLPYQSFYTSPTPHAPDIMVMRTEIEPTRRERHDPRTARSPAPLNRPFSIFSDE